MLKKGDHDFFWRGKGFYGLLSREILKLGWVDSVGKGFSLHCIKVSLKK
jgi:hypothetical protein